MFKLNFKKTIPENNSKKKKFYKIKLNISNKLIFITSMSIKNDHHKYSRLRNYITKKCHLDYYYNFVFF